MVGDSSCQFCSMQFLIVIILIFGKNFRDISFLLVLDKELNFCINQFDEILLNGQLECLKQLCIVRALRIQMCTKHI